MAPRVVEISGEVDAPLDEVWRVLTDVAGYTSWNPFIVKVRSPTAVTEVGARMSLDVRWHDGGKASSVEEVRAVSTPARGDDGVVRASWSYAFASLAATLGMIVTEREQTLEQADGGPTRYASRFTVTGWGKGLVPIAKCRDGFERQWSGLEAEVLRGQPHG